VGIPWDAGTSYRSGARFGPSAIREASRLLRPYNISLELYPFKQAQVVDAGDIPCSPFDIPLAITEMKKGITQLLQHVKKIAVLGGDHTLSYPVLQALFQHHKRPITLIHLDAHLDTYPGIYNQDVWHGSPFRKCYEEKLIDTTSSIHVGVRNTIWSETDFTDSEGMGFACILCSDVHIKGVDWTVQQILKRVRQSDSPVYLSLDIDVIDISQAPGTGTPEVAGLFTYQVMEIIKGLRDLNYCGCDVVEVSPSYDHSQITALAAANIMYQMITAIGGGSQQRTLTSRL